MARVLGLGGIANTNGARSFAGKAEAVADDAYRFRSNNFNRRRYGGMWYPVLFLLSLVR